MQAPRRLSHPSCARKGTPQNIVSLACGALNQSGGQASPIGLKSLSETPFGCQLLLVGLKPILVVNPCPWGPSSFGGPNPLEGSTFACRAQTPFGDHIPVGPKFPSGSRPGCYAPSIFRWAQIPSRGQTLLVHPKPLMGPKPLLGSESYL